MAEKRMSSLLWMFSDDKEILPGINVCDVGYEECDKGHSYGPAVRPYYLFHFVKSGSGIFERGGRRFTLSKNQVFLIRPDELTYYRADDNAPWSYMWLGISGELADSAVSRVLGDECVFSVSNDALLEMESLYHGCLNKGEFAYKIVALLLRTFGDVLAKSEKSNERKPDLVTSAVNFMESNYFRPIDVGSLADEMGVSRSHFTTLFASAMGVSPYNYLLKLRLAKAEKLLIERPSLSVTEIAYTVGFTGVERFSEMFKKYVGLSPLAYRKKKGENL